ncbi:MAG: four helix bundle protein [Gemmatimonadales bacterium]
MDGYRNLDAWQRAQELVAEVYEVTGGFPDSERFGLTSQLRRASVSVCTNIAEGYGRRNPGDLRRFVDIAHGSLSEVNCLIDLSQRLGLVSPVQVLSVRTRTVAAGQVLSGLSRWSRDRSRAKVR